MTKAIERRKPSAIAPRWPSARRCRTTRSPARPSRRACLSSIPAPARASRRRPSASRSARSARAGGSASCSSSRACGTRASARAAKFGDRSRAHAWAKASPGTPRTAPATSPPPTRLGKAQELMADPSFALVLLDELNIALRYDYLPSPGGGGAEGAPTRPACRRHRPQRQAGADRRRRPRHRDDAGQAPFRAGIKAQEGIEF